MKTKKGKKQNHAVKGRRFKIGWIIPIVLLLYVLVIGGHKTYQRYILQKSGICVNAIVYHRYWGYRNIKTKYRFVWQNETFEGISTANADAKYVHKSTFREDYVFLTNDTIVVVFLESNPNINRSNAVVKKKCIP